MIETICARDSTIVANGTVLNDLNLNWAKKSALTIIHEVYKPCYENAIYYYKL